jgi:purine-cytosine permease-like protein
MAGGTLKTDDKEEMKEDYALRKVPQHWRLPWYSIMNVTLGVATAMVFMQMGSLMAIAYGSVNAIWAEVYATVFGGVLGMAVAYAAAKTGLSVNLMSRGAGLGFTGSSITSFIYAINFIMYAAIEGSIMAYAINAYIPSIPIWLLMVIVGVAIIPLNWYGMAQLDKFQKISMPIYIILLLIGIYVCATMDLPHSSDWLVYLPAGATVGGSGLLTSIGVMNGLVGIMALLVADYARFVKPKELKIGVFAAGFIPSLVAFFVSGVIGVYFGVRFGEANPGKYFVLAMGFWGAVYTILTQLRINVTNLYSGSMSLANFFARVFHFTPGRVFWVVITALAAIVAMLAGALDHLGPMLTFQGVFLFAWVALLAADIIVVKGILKLGPTHIEHRRGHLYEWNPVGVISLLVSSGIGLMMAFNMFGPFLASMSAFVAAVIAFVLHIMIAVGTKGKYYEARPVEEIFATNIIETNKYGEKIIKCDKCGHSFITDDMLNCPLHKQIYCSQCCGDASCGTACQSGANSATSFKA